MPTFLCNELEGSATNYAQCVHESRMLQFDPRMRLTGKKDVNYFVSHHEEYTLFNGIFDKNKYFGLKCSLTESFASCPS